MAGKVLEIDELLSPDELGLQIADNYRTWEMLRREKLSEWSEVQKYVFATDTTKTSNANLPWKNKTTIPKLCQVRDNLSANYMAAMFPKRKWIFWEGESQEDNERERREAIESYGTWLVSRNQFYEEMEKIKSDYIDYGNCFATVEWVDQRVINNEEGSRQQVGFVGPVLRRISPLDIVFNPAAPSFLESPKIVRSIVSLGEIKEMLERVSADEGEKEDAQELWNYLEGIRGTVRDYTGEHQVKNDIYQVSGFGNYTDYLLSNYVEVLTFYGDLFDSSTGVFYKNHVIKVVDRHKVISKKPLPSFLGHAPIYHCGWRTRPDNLWAMGPLDNLVGMQYRIDHLENLKADVFDFNAQPMFKVTGYVEPFDWIPGEQIIVGEDGDVEMIKPDSSILNVDNEIAFLEMKMEEIAGSPREAMGFRSPGEKTKYEVQRLENAAGRIFQSKISQFERQITENILNAMIELARRNIDSINIKVFDPEFKIDMFMELTSEDITGNGRVVPIAARHFAEQSQIVQDLSAFFQSGVGTDEDVKVHFSGKKIAEMFERLLNIEDYDVVTPYVRLAERADAQRQVQVLQEQLAAESATATGMGDDYDLDEEASGPQDILGMAESVAQGQGPGGVPPQAQ